MGKTREELGMAPIQRGVSHLVHSKVLDEEVRREVVFEPGHPWIGKDGPPSANYGRGSLQIRHLVHGPLGTAQFLWSTGIVPERETVHVSRETVPGMIPGTTMNIGGYDHEQWVTTNPSGFDIGYHADSPQYEGQSPSRECEYRAGGVCYYDGSSLQGDFALKVFLTKGEEALWELLERRYAIWFKGAEWVGGGVDGE